MKIKMPATLRGRLAILNALLLTGILLVSYLLCYLLLSAWLYRQVDNSMSMLARQVALDITMENNNIVSNFSINDSELEKQRQFMRVLDRHGYVMEHIGPFQELPVKLTDATKHQQQGAFEKVTLPRDDEMIRLYTLPVFFRGKPAGFVQTGQSLETVQNLLQATISTLLFLIPLSLIIAWTGSRWLTYKTLAPLADIANTAEKISGQQLYRRLGIQGEDEVARLAAALDRMLDRLQDAFEGYHQFTGDVSHELRTPLTIIKGELSLALQKERDSKYYHNVLVCMDNEVDRLVRLAEQLLLLARVEGEKMQLTVTRFNIEEALNPLFRQVSLSAAAKNQQLSWQVPGDAYLESDSDVFRQIALNLLDNAFKYTPPEGKVGLTVESLPGKYVMTITNTGEGIPQEHLEHIFDRFYREPKHRRKVSGTGLGLAIVKKLVILLGGELAVNSTFGTGTKFEVSLPAVFPVEYAASRKTELAHCNA